MSTILKALKKLETDAAADSGISIAPVGRNRGNATSRTIRSLYGLLCAAIVFSVGVFLFIKPSTSIFIPDLPARRPQPEGPAVSSVQSGAADRSAETARGRELKNGAAHRNASDSFLESISDDKFKTDPAAKPSGISKPKAEKKPDSLHRAADVQSKPGQNSGPSAEQPATPAASRNKAKIDKAPIALTILEDTDLQIQAISWNKDPARRLAVINSRLCHEGEQIGDYRIITINPDDIVVSIGGTRGKLLF